MRQAFILLGILSFIVYCGAYVAFTQKDHDERNDEVIHAEFVE